MDDATELLMAVHVAQAGAVLAEIRLDRGDRAGAAALARRAVRVSRRTDRRPGEQHALETLAAIRR